MMADAPGAAKLIRHLPAAAGAQGQLDAVRCVEAVERQQIDRVHAQQRERLLQLFAELGGIVVGTQLGLQHEGAARVARQRLAHLLLAGAVAARGLEVVDADRQRARDDRLDVRLAGRADARAAHPALLRAHAATREHRHVDVGSPETPVEHTLL